MKLFAMILALLLTGCATTAREQTIAGGLMDAGTTAAAISSGAIELNPLGPLGALVLKPLAYAYAESLSENDRANAHSLIGSIWTGAAASNVCMLVSANPACYVLGIVSGYKVWESHADERLFWAICRQEQAANPLMKCSYNKPA